MPRRNRLPTSRSPSVTAAVLVTLLHAHAHATDEANFAAPDADSAERARAKAVEAERLYRRKDFAAALARLDEAAALVPSPKLQYNFGLVHEALGNQPAAIDAFERFLAEVPADDPARRSLARKHADQLAARLVALTVRADRDGAEILVDGVARASTPCGRPIWITPGRHQIVVKPPDSAIGYTERIDAPPGRALVIDARLAPPPAMPPLHASVGPIAAPALHASPTQAAPASPWIRRTAYLTTAGAGLAMIVAVGGRLRHNGKLEEFDSLKKPSSNEYLCNTAYPDNGSARCAVLLSEANTARTVSIAAFGTSIAFGVLATTLFLLSPSSDATVAGGTPAIAVAPGEIAASWRLRF